MPTASEFYKPDVNTKFPFGRTEDCKLCVNEANRLEQAWDNLNNFDLAHRDVRPDFDARREAAKAQVELDAATGEANRATDAAKPKKGRSPDEQKKLDAAKKTAEKTLTEKQAKKTQADTTKKEADKKLDDVHKNDPGPGLGGDQLRNELERLLEAIDKYAADLATCRHDKCGAP